jgi:D-alanyl-D-alanine carboxypeptidase/D-alanyl-D-alanine-endopeptidase (penicillin-binding protein 4)
MSSRLLLLVAGLWGLVLAMPASAAGTQGLAPEVEQALQRERVPLEAVSVIVQETGSGATRLALNAQRPVNPASLAKLLTTYAALDQLGPAFTWKTPVWIAGRVGSGAQAGVLDGNIHIQGRGDPKLTLERLWLLVQRLRQMGIAEIRGDIVLDQSAFAVPETSTAEFDNEPLRPYNVRAQALLLNLGAVLYTFTPDMARGVAVVSAEPALAGVQVDATVPLGTGPCNDWRGALKATPGDTERMRFAGSYPLACGERVWPLAYPDGTRYAARLLTALWQAAGGRITGNVREGPAPEGVKPSFEISSPPLAEVVRDINKYSNNVMAQQLLLTLVLQQPNATPATRATPEAGRAALLQWLGQRLGESPESLDRVVIDNGSGLSRETRMSAALLARVLQAAWSSPVMPELMASLPVNGLDGTLRKANSSAGMAHLKTGSLRDVAGVAGYVLGASGKRYVLVAIVNHPNANAAKPALDALVQWTIDDAERMKRPAEPTRRTSK